MFNIIAESKQEITPNKMEIIDCNAYMFYTHKYGDKVIITSGLYVFLVIAALLSLIIIAYDADNNTKNHPNVLIHVCLYSTMLLILIILCNLSTYWNYINQTSYMCIINIGVLVVLLVFSILSLLKGSINIQNIIIFLIICIIFTIITIMYSYIPQSHTYEWLVFNSQMITSIIFTVLLILAVCYVCKIILK
jgi:hypothetical protein